MEFDSVCPLEILNSNMFLGNITEITLKSNIVYPDSITSTTQFYGKPINSNITISNCSQKANSNSSNSGLGGLPDNYAGIGYSALTELGDQYNW